MTLPTRPERPRTNQRVIYSGAHGRPVPEDGSLVPVNWVGDEFPDAAVPGVDMWNGEPIPEGARRIPEHEHDWRVNPNIVLLSNPPQSELLCAVCGATKTRSAGRAVSDDPKDWPKA